MSCNVNNVCIRKPYDSFIMSKHQSKKKDTEESQMNMEATYRKNQQEIMKNLGSPSNSNKYYGY
ncbi:hypothetical protein [Clostridium sporogenes]|uniref:hypothetical protein n=1 Tax=Clostridium sporogenes TaxID=1509 RepID=UPI0005EF85A7|nr:hypothetical protein [Clostridium sporogenes]KOY67544.1 hypothetical protein AN649_02395 [Clostridium sporogenes]MDS1007749.1 hypothetical protein [Clostridium sporogenes]